jgi:hypothetical protein
MGFTIAVPSVFLGSGHPPLTEPGPPHLGLVRSTNRAQTWQPGAGLTLTDLDTDPRDPARVLAATDTELLASTDGGSSFTTLPGQPPQPLLLVDHRTPAAQAQPGPPGTDLARASRSPTPRTQRNTPSRATSKACALPHSPAHRRLPDRLGEPAAVRRGAGGDADPRGAVRRAAMDLDRFKDVNDDLGHHLGDELLRLVGPRLAGCLREGDLLARLGGDESGLLLPDADAEQAVTVAERVRAALQEPFVLGSATVHIDASIGVALAGQDGSAPATSSCTPPTPLCTRPSAPAPGWSCTTTSATGRRAAGLSSRSAARGPHHRPARPALPAQARDRAQPGDRCGEPRWGGWRGSVAGALRAGVAAGG